MLARQQYLWKVDENTMQNMKNAKVGEPFLSPEFESGDLKWKLTVYPNGVETKSAGFFALYLNLTSMPLSWKHVECSYQIRCKDTHCAVQSFTTFERARGWGGNSQMMLSDVQALNSLSFLIDICIFKIVSKRDHVIFQKNGSLVPLNIKWKLDKNDTQYLKRTRNDQSLYSEICDGMWCLRLLRKGDSFGLYVQLCAMPGGLQKVRASWSTAVILKAGGVINQYRHQSDSNSNEFTSDNQLRGRGYWIDWNKVTYDDWSLELNAEIVPDTGFTVHYWNQLLERKDVVKDMKSLTDKVDDDICAKLDENLKTMKSKMTQNKRRINEVTQRQETTHSKLKKVAQDISATTTQLKAIQKRIDSKNEQSQSKLDAISSKMTQNENQMNQHQNATNSKLDAIEQHILSINNQLKSVQQRSTSENQQSQSELLLAQIAKLTENITSLKRAPQDVEIERTNEVKLWMERIVKLPQYYNVLQEQGFDDMESVQEMTMEDLREMGVDMIGHRRKIMKKVRELNEGQMDVIAKDIEIHRARDSMQQVLLCVLPQRDECMISWFHQKSNELRAEVVSKHRLDDLESKEEEDDEYIPLIRKYIEVNKGADPQHQKAVLQIGQGSESCDSSICVQLDIVEKYKVYDHPRLRLENGTFGLKAKRAIPTGSVVGEYLGKYWIVEHLDSLYGTKSYNDINKYAFEELVEVKMPRERIRYYQRSERMEGDEENEGDEVTEDEDIDMESNHNMREPPRKKQRKNEEEHTFNIVLDGVSMKQKGILCFMNDCRQDMECQKPSKDDKKHLNVRFVTSYHRGWPRIFGVAVKDIAAGEELLSFYGDYSDVLNQDRILQIMSNKLRTILAPHGLDNLVNQMT